VFGLSIIKHVTLQKIVAHDFRYDPSTWCGVAEFQAVHSQSALKNGGIAGVAVQTPKDTTSNGTAALIRRWLLVLLIVMMMRNKFSVGTVWLRHITHTAGTLLKSDVLKSLFFQKWILSIRQYVTLLWNCYIGRFTKPISAQNLGETLHLVILKK
jgi:hypothetical protein